MIILFYISILAAIIIYFLWEDEVTAAIERLGCWLIDRWHGFFTPKPEDEKNGYKPRPDTETNSWLNHWLPVIMVELGWEGAPMPERRERLQQLNRLTDPYMRKCRRYYDSVISITTTEYTAHYADHGRKISREVLYRRGDEYVPVYLLEESDSTYSPTILRKGQWIDHLHELYDKASAKREQRAEERRLKELEELHERYGDVD